MINNFTPLIRLPEDEEKRFSEFIKAKRKELILPPKETTTIARNNHHDFINKLLENGRISEAIVQLRELSYDEFLKQESIFNGEILKEIANIFDAPKNLLNKISDELLTLSGVSKEDFYTRLNQLFGVYSGYISPYIYQLCLSNTQSRRSRAGKVFEGIIYSLYDYFGYSFESQANIGKKAFDNLGLGKVVDSILPSVEAFKKLRNRTIVGSMKTTLRERWQEVVEEIQRSNLPNIYLLTVDDDISESKAEQMGQHNIIIVVLNSVKISKKLASRHNVIDFETYFNRDIPSVLSYWIDN
ncbi:type II restriction endonuclease [Gilliamella sp. ESL0254]|uniref:type II restriction endonuclease n=1 Tax=Gilliamella sp. ESL0254 TaxID=2705035 RepID=UPI0015800E9E|nr:type II restriction endonuclease [Gilliamella sp. ESL0254]NUF27027.1 type II restriction endonuclease [Gilliamella sp. ESL0254]